MGKMDRKQKPGYRGSTNYTLSKFDAYSYGNHMTPKPLTYMTI